MKKLLLSLGAVAAVVAPVAAVVACGSNDSDADKTLDGLKALNIKTVNASKLSPELKASAIAEINKVTTVDKLTELMAEVATEMQNAENGAAGTAAGTDTDKTGTETGTPAETVVPETDDEVKAEIKTMITTDILNDETGYSMADDELDKLVEELFKLDGAKDMAAIDILPGIKGDATHGADDFMILIGGAPTEEVVSTDGWADQDSSNTAKKDRLWKDGFAVGLDLEENAKVTALEDRWAQPENEVKLANFVLYLQHKDGTDDVTAQLARVLKFQDTYYETEQTKTQMDKVVAAAGGTSNAADYAMLDLDATYTAPVTKA